MEYRAGKRYYRLDGVLTGILETVVDTQPEFTFRDPKNGILYNEYGVSNQIPQTTDLGDEYILEESLLLCPHCRQEVRWSRLFQDWWCGGCRTHDTFESTEEEK